jgi:hypothetical protein
MKKLVSESVQEYKERKFLQEGVFSKIGEVVKGLFRRVGKFFFRLVNGEPNPRAILPINVGIMDKGNYISDAVSYIPNKADLEMEPGLGSLTADKAIAKRGPDTIKESKEIYEAVIALEHPDKNVPNVDKKSLSRWIRMSIDNPKERPLMIWGAPGIGKTQIVKAVLKSMEGKRRLIDVQTSKMAPDDWALPAIYKTDTGDMKAVDLPKSWLPVYRPSGDPEEDQKLDEAANQGDGGVIFFDELSRAAPSVQNTCLKIMDEKIIGDAVLGSKWSIIAASNRTEDDPDSDISFGKALGNRFTQINYVPDFQSWKEWAIDKIDPRLLDFLEFNQEYFYNMDDDPEQSIFASPRSWDEASVKLGMLMQDAEKYNEPITNKDITEVIGANVGMDIATEFNTFLRVLDSFKKEDIRKVFTDPDKAPLPKKAGTGYDQSQANAITALVISSTRGKDLDPKEFTNFCKYLVKLDNASLATRALKLMFEVHPDLHEELGEVDGRDKYKEGVDIFIEKYRDIF